MMQQAQSPPEVGNPGAMASQPQRGQLIPFPNASQVMQNFNDMLPIPGGRHVDMTFVSEERALQARGAETLDGLPGHRLEQFYNAFVTGKREELLDALKAEEYYHGKQWSPDQKAVLQDRKQPATYFNELRKKINSYIGLEQRLRRDPKASPRTPKHEGDADAATAALRYIGDATMAETQFTEAGRDFFVRGIGVLYQGVVRDHQNKVQAVKQHVSASNFIYDPRSMKHDFSDAKFMGEWGWYDADDAEDLFIKLGRPDSAEKMAWLVGNLHGSSSNIPGELAKIRTEWYARDLGRVRLVHLYYKHRGKWRYAIFCGHVSLYDAPSIYFAENGESAQPYVAISCEVDEQGKRYGVVKDLIPIQDSINQRHSRLFHLLAQRRVIADKGAVDDINKARREVNKADGYVELNPRGKDAVEKRFKIDEGGAEVEGQYKLLELSIEQMRQYGPNTAILGKGEGINSQSGRAILALQNAGMTELSPVFDRHRSLKMLSWRRDWQNVVQFWDDERWIPVLDDDAEKGVKFVALNQVKIDPVTGAISVANDVAKMDIDIIFDESGDTITQTEEALDFMSKLGEAAVGPAGELFIELSNLRNKDKLLRLIRSKQPQTNPKEAELRDKVMFLEAALKAATVDKTLAEVENKRADSLSKLAAAGVPSQAMQVFPFDYGVRSTYEDFLGEDVHQFGNAFEFVPPPQIPLDAMAQPGRAPSTPNAYEPGRLTGQMSQGQPAGQPGHAGPVPQGVIRNGMQTPGETPAEPWMPGQEPQMGDGNGLPFPPEFQGSGGLMPPPGTRPN